jgi:hypothetical protein
VNYPTKWVRERMTGNYGERAKLIVPLVEVVFNGTNRELTCSGGNCWNLMV